MTPKQLSTLTAQAALSGIEVVVRSDTDTHVERFSVSRSWHLIRYLHLEGEAMLRLPAARQPECPLDALSFAAGALALASEFESLASPFLSCGELSPC